MPVLDSLKSALADHLSTLVTRMTLGSSGGEASSRDGGAGSPQITITPSVTKIDDRTVSVSGVFTTSETSSETLKEIVLHGDTALDTPAFRATFMPIDKTSNNEVRVDVLMEVR
jgi:hypothetical protein|tara:strand:- start:1294 stop:1635 length:342 start_codon:yes stop_codon:yes gene_type:complete